MNYKFKVIMKNLKKIKIKKKSKFRKKFIIKKKLKKLMIEKLKN